ncbi:AAA family ATPase [Aureimonas ureilytica]|uniref:AAA family ATPase n=1 Tax=Aureimonas ureilytica TaxID=401562 RepID=UPI000A3E357D|nr:AAA family ATPase [Aureimonas ureilytica]
MHRLSFVRPYLSIEALPDTELPDFTLLTGMNGAGKSHLLRAILNGDIRSDCAPNQNQYNQQEIRMFDWNTMVPQDSGYFSGDQLTQERINYYNQFQGIAQQPHYADNIRNTARNLGIPADIIGNLRALSEADELELNSRGVPDAANAVLYIKQAFDSAEASIMQNIGDENAKEYLRNASFVAKKPVITLEQREIVTRTVPVWGRNEVFQQSFSRLFVSYRDAYMRNTLGNYRKSKGSTVEHALSDADFLALHGPAPWDFVNEILSSAGLNFRINAPDLDSTEQYRPILTKIISGKEIEFTALSSGEKILMSFAFCVYYASDRRQISVFPKLLLLDEIDAPLHPSMSRNMIDTINNTLVGQFGIKVIATTHSPSTLALTPEDAVLVIRANDPGVHKISKSEALNILTHGVPTLAVSYDGRRQVFVESPADAKIYDGIYKLQKSDIKHERSLDFIATGVRNAIGEERNTGCDAVKRIVNSLVEAGNKSVMGLIDWDGTNDPENRLHVLAHGKKNGLENVILDPLVIGLVIAKNSIADDKTPIIRDTGYFSAMNGDIALKQKIADEVSSAVFSDPPTSNVQNKYSNGMILDIDVRWHHIDDHDLEDKIIMAFPRIRSITKGRSGVLMQHIVESIFFDNKGLIPVDMKETFQIMLDTNTQ